MSIKLNDSEIKGHELIVTAVSNIQSSDLSGINTSTSSAFEGFKPKRLDVSLKIKYDNSQDLSDIQNLYETLENGDQKIFLIYNRTADAIGMRQARFDGNLRIAESLNLQEWTVNFTLIEVQSIPELKEKQRENLTNQIQEASQLP